MKLIIALDITADGRQVETLYLIKAAASRTVRLRAGNVTSETI